MNASLRACVLALDRRTTSVALNLACLLLITYVPDISLALRDLVYPPK